MDSFLTTDRIARLAASTDVPETQPGEPGARYDIAHEYRARRKFQSWGISLPTASEDVSASIKSEIVRHRIPRTSTSRIIEATVSETTARFSLPAVAMYILFARLCAFFKAMEQKKPQWLAEEIKTFNLKDLCRHGNFRQQFHAIRDLLRPFRILMLQLSDNNPESRNLLCELGELGVIIPGLVQFFVSTAAFGNLDEILSPPEHLRQIWKPVARERVAPEDGGRPGWYTKQLWNTNMRVGECYNPPVSLAEVQDLFGEDATPITHADERLPYACGAHKYALVETERFVIDCTNQGLFTTSGPSGTAYRYLNLWLVLGGSRDKVPEMRFAVATALLAGNHHSLIEVLAVCAPIAGCGVPTSWQQMLEQLVPRDLQLTLDGESHMVAEAAFFDVLGDGVDKRFA